MKQDDTTYQRIEAYLSKQMDDLERERFEKEMQVDPELRQFVQLQSEIEQQFSNQDWVLLQDDGPDKKALSQYFASEEAHALERKLRQIAHEKLTPLRSMKARWWSAAAAVIGLLLLGIWIVNRPVNEAELYFAYAQHQNLNLVEKGEEMLDFSKAESLYNAGQFAEALPIIQQLRMATDTTPDYRLWVAEGVCLLETKQLDQARERFRLLDNSDALLQYEAAWYLALIALKKGDIERTQTQLERILILEEHPYRLKAQDLKNDLDNLSP